MASPIVSYALDDETVVRFEVEPSADWYEVSADQVLGQIRQAVTPALEGAMAVLDKARESSPDEIEVKFAIKVSGTMNWVIAKAATEGNFEISLLWKAGSTTQG